MNNSFKKIILLTLVISLTPFYLFAAESANTQVTAANENTLAEGKIKRYTPETKTILLQQKDGEKLQIVLDWNTIFVGYKSPEEIVKGDKVKIWYSIDAKKATAAKIEKKLMVGC